MPAPRTYGARDGPPGRKSPPRQGIRFSSVFRYRTLTYVRGGPDSRTEPGRPRSGFLPNSPQQARYRRPDSRHVMRTGMAAQDADRGRRGRRSDPGTGRIGPVGCAWGAQRIGGDVAHEEGPSPR
ncbi:hypothetical protein GCM10010392_08780 [Streptomyces clavifer]|nr:hypothetical protein GCM10010392_08780 [Streptomyces clavifer]